MPPPPPFGQMPVFGLPPPFMLAGPPPPMAIMYVPALAPMEYAQLPNYFANARPSAPQPPPQQEQLAIAAKVQAASAFSATQKASATSPLALSKFSKMSSEFSKAHAQARPNWS